jgi:hypothetical protein
MIGAVGGGLAGALFFWWIAGWRVINPMEFAWLMKLDWRINFLGWHLFRNDPWRLPPGTIEGYLAGEGTTIGLTDSIPLAALLLKPFDAWLPTPFQYFGAWLLLCFALQGMFGALLAGLYTRHTWLQLASAALFVLVPTLLMRVGHAALTAHFVLLWAIWIYLRRGPQPLRAQHATLGLIAGLTHPYLAAMTLAILAAVPIRERTMPALTAWLIACGTTVVAWWLAGFIAVGSTSDLAAGGLGLYSMNLLSPITPRGWSALLPEWPVVNELQAYEGFQYLGVGILLLFSAACGIALRQRHVLSSSRWLPLAAISLVAAAYAVSPRVTLGAAVLVDWTTPALDRLAFFRATGRFFWPMAYLALTAAVALVTSRLRPRVAGMILALAVVIQAIDLYPAHAERRATSRSDGFHAWPRALTSPAWDQILPLYDHLMLVPASQCGGGAPLEHEELAYLAGLHGLTINSGLGARWDEGARRRHCEALGRAVAQGNVNHRSIYVVSAAAEERLRAADAPIVCATIDVARICVTAASHDLWQR